MPSTNPPACLRDAILFSHPNLHTALSNGRTPNPISVTTGGSMKIRTQGKRKADYRERGAELGYWKSRRPISKAHAKCWLKGTGYYARMDLGTAGTQGSIFNCLTGGAV